jgi:hypothetical protein
LYSPFPFRAMEYGGLVIGGMNFNFSLWLMA